MVYVRYSPEGVGNSRDAIVGITVGIRDRVARSSVAVLRCDRSGKCACGAGVLPSAVRAWVALTVEPAAGGRVREDRGHRPFAEIEAAVTRSDMPLSPVTGWLAATPIKAMNRVRH